MGKGGFDKIQVGFVLLLEYGSAANGTDVPSATRMWLLPPRRLNQQTRPKDPCLKSAKGNLGRGELGDGLGALGDGVLGKLTGEHKADSSLDLPGGEGSLLVVGGKLSGLAGDALEDVVDEGVHDGHALLGDAGIRVDLLKDLVDVGAVALGALLLAPGGGLLGGLGGLLGALGWCLSHGCSGNECNRTGRVVRAGRGRRAEHSMPERVGGA